MELFPLLIAEARKRLLDESIPRLRKCLAQLGEQAVWYRPNEHSNAVGNLVLHLAGNTRQWLGAGLMQMEDVRQRAAEFDERGPLPKEKLSVVLDDTAALIDRVLNELQPEQLVRTYDVQVFQETGIGILIHVIEHFSYHTGQVSYITKALLDVDLEYYAGLDL